MIAGINNVRFITGAFGHKKYSKAAKRLKQNLSKIGLGDNLTIYDEKKLKEVFPLYERLFVERHSVGYGAWIWKPLIVRNELKKLNENDVLIYLDVGCEISCEPRAIGRLIEYIKLAEEKGIVVFENNQLEKKYTHSKVYLFFGYHPSNVEDDIQVSASVLLVSNTCRSISMIDKWASACIYNDGILAFDENDVIPEVLHRNDQSILSVLLKIEKTPMILPNESYFPTPEYLKSTAPYLYPFHTTRNFTEWSFMRMYYVFYSARYYFPLRLRLLAVQRLTCMLVHISLLKSRLFQGS